MSLGKENFPKDKHLIFDVDVAIYALSVQGNAFQKMVLRGIKKAKFVQNGNLYFDERTETFSFKEDSIDAYVNLISAVF